MKTLSYIIDLAVFFILLYAFDVNWIVAFIISEIVGWSIRAAFISKEKKEEREALEALGWKPDRKETEEVARKPAPRTPIQPATPTAAPAVATGQKPRVKTNALAIASLVLGIVAIPLGCCYGFGALFGIAALIAGLIGHRQAKESGGAQSGEGMALAGTILGGVSILLGIASLLMFLIVLIAPLGVGN